MSFPFVCIKAPHFTPNRNHTFLLNHTNILDSTAAMTLLSSHITTQSINILICFLFLYFPHKKTSQVSPVMKESDLNNKTSVDSKKPDDRRIVTCLIGGDSEDIVGEKGKRRFDKEVVGIPEKWGKEELLKDWIDHTSFDSCLAPKGILSARAALVAEGRRARSAGLGLRVEILE